MPSPSAAQQPPESLAADSCVTYREDGDGGYRLANSCDYPIELAYCPQSAGDPALCTRVQAWSRERLGARAEGEDAVAAGLLLDLFACRQPGTVEILPSGMARCSAVQGPREMPFLLSASLKNPGAVITDRDYPASNHDKEGTTRFELIVGPDGKPLSCTTTVSSGYDVLDRAACNAFVKRARFSPAKDADGAPTTGRYRGSVTWKAP